MASSRVWWFGRGALGWLAAVVAFLATRVAFLDRDVPPWDLARYQPIDEFAYALPAFNLHHYGAWTHQAATYAPVEGSPMNVLQSLVAAATLTLDWSYYGFRLSSVLFTLVAFGAMIAVVRRLARSAGEEGTTGLLPPRAIVVGSVVLLLVDFGFLMAGRVVEASTARVAVIAGLLWLISRGTFLGPGHTAWGTLMLGVLAGLSVGFGYVYDAFLIPGAILLVAWWGWSHGGVRSAVGHACAAGAGSAAALVAYFVAVYLVYGYGPSGWYDRWLSVYEESGRAAGLNPAQLWDLATGNLFRLDRPFMVLVLLGLPAFAWWAWRSRDRLGVAVLAIGLAFVAQCMVQSDYPQRKMLVLMPIVLPIAAGGLLRFDGWRAAITTKPRRTWLVIAWMAIVAVFTVVLIAPPSVTRWSTLRHLLGLPAATEIAYRTGTAGLLLAICGLLGLAAALVLLAARSRPWLARASAGLLSLSMIVPLLALDGQYVFTHMATTYRDAMTSVAPQINGQVTAGSLSFAMQLYNTSLPEFEGAPPLGMTIEEYEAAVVRYFASGQAATMFGYADKAGLAEWTKLGFRLVETYPIVLPKNRLMGRYLYAGPSAAP